MSEKQSKKTLVSCRGYFSSLIVQDRAQQHVTVCWGGKGTRREAGLVPGEGAGKSAGSDGDLSSHTRNSAGRSLTAVRLLREALSWQPFLQAPARQGHVSQLGSMPVEMSGGDTQGTESVFPEPPMLQPWAYEPSHSSSCCRHSYLSRDRPREAHETMRATVRFLSSALISSKLSLYWWPHMVSNKATSITVIVRENISIRNSFILLQAALTLGADVLRSCMCP